MARKRHRAREIGIWQTKPASDETTTLLTAATEATIALFSDSVETLALEYLEVVAEISQSSGRSGQHALDLGSGLQRCDRHPEEWRKTMTAPHATAR